MPDLLRRLDERVLVLDGGLATQLEARGHDISGSLWSAGLMLRAPGAIDQAQRDFLAAGADVVTTATYQASHAGFASLGLSAPEVDRLLINAVGRARAVADSCDRHVVVVGSIGPYGAMLHDGSEYTGDYDLTVAELRAFHRRRLEVLAAGCDVIAAETIPQLREVEALTAELSDLPVPWWLSVSARGDELRTGDSAADAFAIAASGAGVVAVGANCIDPADAAGLARLAASTGRPAIVYPNSGESWSDDRWHGRPSGRPDPIPWVAAGARIVGGCCRVTPSQIAAIATAVH